MVKFEIIMKREKKKVIDMIETPTGILWIELEINKPQLNTAK